MSYTKHFTKPYKNGYKDRPDKTTPVTADIKNMETETLLAVEEFLEDVPSGEDMGGIYTRLDSLENYKHDHDNKETLDKFAESNGKLIFNGENVTIKDLKDMNSDATHRTVTDAQIEEWNNKGGQLPIASETTLGGVKIGNNLVIDKDGVLSATGGGGTGAVESVNGKTGKVVLELKDLDGDETHRTVSDAQIEQWNAGGSGTVKTINYKEPDEEGNISLTHSDVGALKDTTKLKDLPQDDTHKTVTQADKDFWDNKQDALPNIDTVLRLGQTTEGKLTFNDEPVGGGGTPHNAVFMTEEEEPADLPTCEDLPFKFGIVDGKYGYYMEDGTFVPFGTGGGVGIIADDASWQEYEYK